MLGLVEMARSPARRFTWSARVVAAAFLALLLAAGVAGVRQG